MKTVNLLFPHQLFEKNPLFENDYPIYLVEEFLFFKQYAFHKQKIAFHRASMQQYKVFLENNGGEVHYISINNELSDVRELIKKLDKDGIEWIHYIDVTDNWLEKRIQSSSSKADIECKKYVSPLFLNSPDDNKHFFKSDKTNFYHTTFYKQQRKNNKILLKENETPVGDQWSFDKENRKKYPAEKEPPNIEHPDKNEFFTEAKKYVEQHFSENPGTLADTPLYPTNFEEAQKWFLQFLKKRFDEFGPFEDAIVIDKSFLNHSVLTPMLNVGLILPDKIIKETLQYAEKNDIPINSTEGFIRQIIGWREFIRGMYECKGGEERTKNFWGFKRKIPDSFYNGTRKFYVIM